MQRMASALPQALGIAPCAVQRDLVLVTCGSLAAAAPPGHRPPRRNGARSEAARHDQRRSHAAREGGSREKGVLGEAGKSGVLWIPEQIEGTEGVSSVRMFCQSDQESVL